MVVAPKPELAAPPKLNVEPVAAGAAALEAAGAPKLKELPVEAAGAAPKAGVDAAGGAPPKLKPVGAAVLAAGAPNAGGAVVFGAEDVCCLYMMLVANIFEFS